MSSLSQAATAAEKRTNARYWIVVMLFIVTSFNYGDRATLSMSSDLSLTTCFWLLQLVRIARAMMKINDRIAPALSVR